MSEQVHNFEQTPDAIVTFADQDAFIAQTAWYEASDDPEAVLRRGLTEETDELVTELLTVIGQIEYGAVDADSFERFDGELGDAQYYPSAVARLQRTSLAAVLEVPAETPLDDYVIEVGLAATQPFDLRLPDSSSITIDEQPAEALTLLSLRLLDALNPQQDELWPVEGHEDEQTVVSPQSPTEALRCLQWGLCRLAANYGVSLQQAATKTRDKVYSRDRLPNVINLDNEQALITSNRVSLNARLRGLMLKRYEIEHTEQG